MPEDITNKLKSAGERTIATALDHYGIPFIYEPKLPILDSGRRRVFRPDFYLPNQDIYIEYFGRAGNDGYDLRSAEKMRLYEAHRYSLIPLYPWDLCKGWPDGLLARIGQAERQAAQQSPPYTSRTHMPYRSSSRLSGYGARGIAGYRR